VSRRTGLVLAGVIAVAVLALGYAWRAPTVAVRKPHSVWTLQDWSGRTLGEFNELDQSTGILATNRDRRRISFGSQIADWQAPLSLPGTDRNLVHHRALIIHDRFDKVALDTATGAEIWRTRVDTETAARDDYSTDGEVLGGDRLALWDRYGPMKALDPNTGRIVWTVPKVDKRLDDIVACAIAEVGPIVCTWTGQHLTRGGLYALDRDTGARLWSTDLPTRSEGGISGPMIDHERIVVLAGDRKVRSWDHDGTLRWTTSMPDAGWHPPVPVPDGTIFVPGRVGYFAQLRASDGHVLWRTHLPGIGWNFTVAPGPPWKVAFESTYDKTRVAVVNLTSRQLYVLHFDQPKELQESSFNIGRYSGRLYLRGGAEHRSRLDAYDDW
jgi:outer membrane protein assembly factor BamB